MHKLPNVFFFAFIRGSLVILNIFIIINKYLSKFMYLQFIREYNKIIYYFNRKYDSIGNMMLICKRSIYKNNIVIF